MSVCCLLRRLADTRLKSTWNMLHATHAWLVDQLVAEPIKVAQLDFFGPVRSLRSPFQISRRSTIELDELYRTTERLFGSGRTVTLESANNVSLGRIVTFSETLATYEWTRPGGGHTERRVQG